MKRIALVLLGILVMGIPLFAGGQAAGKTAEADGLSTVKILGVNIERTLGGKNVKLSDWYDGTVKSRLWEQFTAELAKRGVKLDLELIMPDQMQTVFQTTLAAGKLNDYDMVTFGWDPANASDALLSNLYSQNRLAALNKIIEQYSTGPAKDYFFNDETGIFFRKLQTTEDGNFYWLPGTQTTYYKDPSYAVGSYISGMIRWDWLQALGLGVPKTPDEFYNALVAFQQNDMNKNSVKDEVAAISITGFDTGVAQWFGLGNSLVSVINYKAVSPWYQPHAQEYITYLNRLYKAGLLKVDTEGGAMQANRIAYQNNWSVETWDEPGINVPAGAAKAYFVPLAMHALPDRSGLVWEQSGRNVQWTPSIVPARAKNPAGVAKILDYQVTNDYALLTEYGIEGYTFRYDSNGSRVRGDDNPNNVGVDVELIRAGLPGIWTNGCIIPRNMIDDKYFEVLSTRNAGYPLKADFLETLYAKTYPTIMDSASFLAFATTRETERITTISPDLNTYSSELLTSLILGEKSLSNWSTYMADLKRLGLDELISIYQTRLDRAR
jgi:hypothetical protein